MASLVLLDYKVCLEMTEKLVPRVLKDIEAYSVYKDYQVLQDPLVTKDRQEITVLMASLVSKGLEALRAWMVTLVLLVFQEHLVQEGHKARRENVVLAEKGEPQVLQDLQEKEWDLIWQLCQR